MDYLNLGGKHFVLLALLFSANASALLEYEHLLVEKQVNLLPFLVTPYSCNEFVSAGDALLEGHLPLEAEMESAFELAVQSKKRLLEARKIALLQQFYWAATPNSYPYYLGASYLCHAQALASLNDAVKASRLALKSTSEELEALQFEAGSATPGSKAAIVLGRLKHEQKALDEGRGNAPIARLLLSASSKTSASWENALSSQTAIVQSVWENFKLLAALAQFKQEASQAAGELQEELLEKQGEFSVASSVAKTRLQFVAQEQLEQVADEWFAFLPSGSVAVSGSQPSFRETVRNAQLDFEEAEALAIEGSKAIEARKQGWVGKSLELYAGAAGKAASSLAYAQAAEERSLALEESLSKSVAQQTSGLYEKGGAASQANPFGSAYAHSVARQTSLAYEELAGAPRGKKIREFVGLLKNLREAGEVAAQSPSFRWALDFLEEQVADAKRVREAAQKDGLETSFYEKQLKQAEDAVAQLKQSRSEDYTLAASLSGSILDLRNSLKTEVERKFEGLAAKLSLLGRLKQYFSQEERRQLELYSGNSYFGVDLAGYSGSLGEASKWAEEKLAELSSNSSQIVGGHLRENSHSRQRLQAAPLDFQALGEIFWGAEHSLPLDSQHALSVQLPELEGTTELKLEHKSAKITRLSGNSLLLSSSLQGETHYAVVSFRKIVARKTGEKSSATATGDLLTKRTAIQFSALAATRVIFNKKVSGKTMARAETQNAIESSQTQTPGGKEIVFSVEAREGPNEIVFVEETPQPVSVKKSVFYDDAVGKLSILYEISNELDEQITSLQLDLQENVACIEGKTTVSYNGAQAVEQKRSGPLLATRFSGMNFAAREKQAALLEVQCNTISKYARAKLQELASNPQAPVFAAQELSDAQNALQAGQFARAAELSASAENKISEAGRKLEGFWQKKDGIYSRAAALEARGLQLLNASMEGGEKELASAGEEIVSSASKARSLVEGLSNRTANAEEEKRGAEILAQAEAHLSESAQTLTKAGKLLQEEISSVLSSCGTGRNAVETAKAAACALAKELSWQAKEKLLLEKPGSALRLLQKARATLEEWRKQRESKLSENREAGEELKNVSSRAAAALQKAGKALLMEVEGAGSGSAGRKPEFQLAVAASKSLQAELSKAGKISKVIDSGAEHEILAFDGKGIGERKERLENATVRLEAALAEIELLAALEVESAQKRSGELGDAKSAEKVSQAKARLQAGSLITAFTLASTVNDELGRRPQKSSAFGVREAVLAGSGIAILILLAFVFTRKRGTEEQEIEMREIEEAVAAVDNGEGAAGAKQKESAQGSTNNENPEAKRKRLYY